MDINASIQEAIQKTNSGDLQSAQVILANVLRQEPRNARAWYLLSQVIGDRNREIDCLKKVLEIEPNSQQARARLQKLQQGNIPTQPKPAIPSVQPIPKNKKTNALWIFLILGLGIVALCLVVYTYIQNLPDATNCVQIVDSDGITGVTEGANVHALLWGDIKNTCDKPITKITLHASIINPSNNQVLGETTNQESYILALNAKNGACRTVKTE